MDKERMAVKQLCAASETNLRETQDRPRPFKKDASVFELEQRFRVEGEQKL